MCRCHVAVGGCLGKSRAPWLFVWNGSHHSGWRLVSEDPSWPTAAWSCLSLSKGSVGRWRLARNSCSLIFLGGRFLYRWALGTDPTCPSSRFGGTRGASSWGPLPCVELQVPDCLFQPLSGSSIKHQLLREASCLPVH